MTYQEAVDYIYHIPKFNDRGKTGNDNLMRIMNKMGNPHMACPAIHIAGTNGKGSTAQFIKELLVSAGYNVGIFTSPHLVRVNERIAMVQGKTEQMISDDEFLDVFLRIKAVVDEETACGNAHISFFEYIFAMAALYFADKDLDFVIYETGLGGRLDATNILMPSVCVITAIGLDHTMYLGNTIEEIAAEKAGIIKGGVPVVYGTGYCEADAVIEEIAAKKDANAINVAKTKYIINEFTDKTIDFSVRNRYYNYDHLKLENGNALYQVDNAILALHACHALFDDGSVEKGVMAEDVVKRGLLHFRWQGRMERYGSHLVLDGAHNPDAIKRFTETVKALYGSRDISLFFAVSSDKDYITMTDILCSELKLKNLYVTALQNERGVSAGTVADLFRQHVKCRDIAVCADDDLRTLFLKAYGRAVDENDILFCAGSLYLVGAIKELVDEPGLCESLSEVE
ncbi:MAG: bifunctional folylpolyglutamate synthase/dihydrofolate synthase [Clostridium sp.]|nr:bifunctional folylpolyglutamate synthase/dihydrofolate synthase [Clostridium sp.]MCM1399283.1 bifunctional folylpolyglutamate synthase/dihydrofolate synthase [Clostridium sp.]MCM1459771.1 bifunctional folylpolyglutamate synthase/dihydrofolate synthase [Bacteroides sp.]